VEYTHKQQNYTVKSTTTHKKIKKLINPVYW